MKRPRYSCSACDLTKHGREIVMRLIDGNGRVKSINIPKPFAALVLINGALLDVCKQV